MQLQINPEFKAFFPALTEERYSGLERSILKEGVRNPIVTWNGVIVDGHNRYDICQRHNIPFKTIEIEFENDADAMQWMKDNQNNGHNLTVAENIQCQMKIEAKRAEMAKENQIRKPESVLMISSKQTEPIHVRAESAAAAGVSEDTYRKGKEVLLKAPEEIKQKFLEGRLKPNTAYALMQAEQQPTEKRCTDCGLTKPSTEFSVGRSMCKECDSFRRHNGKDSVKAIKQFSSAKAQAIIDELSKEMPSCEGGEMSDPDNHILADYVALVKQFRIDINKYLYMPSLFSGLSADDLACTETTKLINDLNKIIEKEKE